MLKLQSSVSARKTGEENASFLGKRSARSLDEMEEEGSPSGLPIKNPVENAKEERHSDIGSDGEEFWFLCGKDVEPCLNCARDVSSLIFAGFPGTSCLFLLYIQVFGSVLILCVSC